MSHEQSTDEPGTPEKHRSARILVIDDETSVLYFLEAVLSLMGYDISLAKGEASALRLASAETFDLAIVDYFLENASGVEVARKLRELQPRLKIALMSGYVVADKTTAMSRAGAGAFLIKPFTAEIARGIVARLLHEKDSAPLPAPDHESPSPAVRA
jgi:DNA-binding NtrC family response regulator